MDGLHKSPFLVWHKYWTCQCEKESDCADLKGTTDKMKDNKKKRTEVECMRLSDAVIKNKVGWIGTLFLGGFIHRGRHMYTVHTQSTDWDISATSSCNESILAIKIPIPMEMNISLKTFC